MSSGRVHLKASLTLSAGFAIGAMLTVNPKLLICAGGSLAGILLTPDLDVDKTYIGDKIIEERVGWFGKRVWMWLWKPYKTSFKHGRFASHFPVFSTFTRLSYIYFWLIFLPHILIKLLFNPHWDLIYVLSWYATMLLDIYFFIGLAGSDFLHYCLDKLTKESK